MIYRPLMLLTAASALWSLSQVRAQEVPYADR